VDEENLRLLQEKSLLICLTAPPETLVRRSGSGRARPLLQGEDRVSKIEALLNRREKIYAQARLVLDTGDLSIDGVVDKILEQIRITEGTVRIGRT
jgi:shikimate kinase